LSSVYIVDGLLHSAVVHIRIKIVFLRTSLYLQEFRFDSIYVNNAAYEYVLF
jgi:hypothetical protein